MQTATANQIKPEPGISTPKQYKAAAKTAKPISWKEFERRYLCREDRFKYEWVNGLVEKTTRRMDQSQFFILQNLRDLFSHLIFSKKISGYLEPEIDSFFLDAVHRRPDVSYFTEAQKAGMKKGVPQIPEFVIEIVSNNDQMNRVYRKMQDYRDAGVRVVWMILPKLEEVHVLHGEGLMEIKVCKGSSICSAAPILPDFEMTADDIFK